MHRASTDRTRESLEASCGRRLRFWDPGRRLITSVAGATSRGRVRWRSRCSAACNCRCAGSACAVQSHAENSLTSRAASFAAGQAPLAHLYARALPPLERDWVRATRSSGCGRFSPEPKQLDMAPMMKCVWVGGLARRQRAVRAIERQRGRGSGGRGGRLGLPTACGRRRPPVQAPRDCASRRER